VRPEPFTRRGYVAAFREIATRIALPDGLEVAYRDEDGSARLLYFDRQYDDTLGLVHEDAQEDSISLTLDVIESHVLDVRVLTPVDLARRGLVSATNLERRASEALAIYVGDTQRLRRNIASAVRIVMTKSPVS
jgi:hypothetical protein